MLIYIQGSAESYDTFQNDIIYLNLNFPAPVCPEDEKECWEFRLVRFYSILNFAASERIEDLKEW